MSIKVTDSIVGKSVFVSIQARRNYLNDSKECARIVVESLPVFRELLDLPKDLFVRIATKPGNMKGSYLHSQRLVFINVCNFNYDAVMITLAHELVHAEQFKKGKLKIHSTNKGYVHYWNGERVTNKGKTYSSYRKQPWEAEAFGRQEELVRQATKKLNKKFC